MQELKLPLTLVGISLVIFGVYGFILAGPAAGVGLVLTLLMHAVIAVVLGVAACFVTAYILGTDFGTFQAAAIKLAAASMFRSAVVLLIALISPVLGGLAFIILLFWLLKLLFDLEIFELIVFVLILWGVDSVTQEIIGRMLVSAS